MKTIFTILFLTIMIGLTAQHEAHLHHPQCGVIDQSTLVKRMRANRAAHKTNLLEKSMDVRHIPVKLHLVANYEGQGRIDFSNVLEEMCFSNEIFQSFDMNLFMADGVNLVDDDSLYFYEGMYSDTASYRNDLVLDLKEAFGPNHVNIFISNEAGAPNVAGFNNPFLDFIFVQKDQMGNGESTFSHELGHFFSIQHPHLGWEGEPYDDDIHGDTVRIVTIGADSILVEHMNKENCEVAGDNICDTPPDYNFGITWASDCRPFTRRVWDANGDLIVTSERNIMSYFFGCDDIFFSPGQVEAMELDLASAERDFLQTDYIPVTDKIEEEVVLISPEFRQEMDFYNSVPVEWSEVENATEYYIKVRGGGKELTYFSKDTVILIEDLAPRATYNITIHPFNESGGCASSVSSLFRTSDAVTSLDDFSLIQNLSIYPNPMGQNQNLVVDCRVATSADVQIEIRTLDGRLLQKKAHILQQGVNRIVMDVENVESGLYLVSMHSNKGQIVKKVVVQ